MVSLIFKRSPVNNKILQEHVIVDDTTYDSFISKSRSFTFFNRSTVFSALHEPTILCNHKLSLPELNFKK